MSSSQEGRSRWFLLKTDGGDFPGSPVVKTPCFQCRSGRGNKGSTPGQGTKILHTNEPGGLQSMGSQRVGHDWEQLTLSLYTSPCGQKRKKLVELVFMESLFYGPEILHFQLKVQAPSFAILDTWCEELTHWKRPWCWERLKAGGEGNDRGWDGHHWPDGHEFEQALVVGDGEGSLACCSLWGHKESDMTERLNWTENRCAHKNCSMLNICGKCLDPLL